MCVLSVVFVVLVCRAGGDVFMKGVRVYLKQFAYKNASTGAKHGALASSVPLVSPGL